MRREEGFSVIELLIVAGIILAIAAIAIPNILRSKMSANEASAVSSVRAVATAQTSYSIAYPLEGFADKITKLGGPPAGQPVSKDAADLVAWVTGCAAQPCPKAGYQFSIGNTQGAPVITAYQVVGTPLLKGTTGRRGFCCNQVPTMTYDPDGGGNCTAHLE